jgi:hypothetical protein
MSALRHQRPIGYLPPNTPSELQHRWLRCRYNGVGSSRAFGHARISPSPAQMPGFYFQREARATEKSMADNLELAIFLAVLIAFVVCGCLVTRVPKKTPHVGPVKH